MKYTYWLLLIGVLFMASCDDDDDNPPTPPVDDSLTDIAYNPVSYTLEQPPNFPPPNISPDNPLTVDAIELGRRLFYDPILSADSTLSCAGCHKVELAFSDDVALSKGIDGAEGIRNAMPLINLAFNTNGFNWDGAAATLEDQAVEPVINAIELHDTWTNVETKLQRHADYPMYFRKAFGIERKSQIVQDFATKALAQFIYTLVSDKSFFDRASGFVQGSNPILSPAQQRGRLLFSTEAVNSSDKECTHCHKLSNRLFTDNTYRNNGLDEAATLMDFPDQGYGAVTGNPANNGQFRVPTLRNIELTGPYMHDGRHQTLDDVLEHYANHLKPSPNISGDLGARISDPITFTPQEKADMIEFLKTLTDTTFTNNPAFQNPF